MCTSRDFEGDIDDATAQGSFSSRRVEEHSTSPEGREKAQASGRDSHEDGREVAATAVDEAKASLSAQERYRLTLWKWRYSFERLGFENSEVSNLVFLLWRVRTGKVQ